jgi:hypothetical protein
MLPTSPFCGRKPASCAAIKLGDRRAAPLRDALDAAIDFRAERSEINWLGQQRLSAILQRLRTAYVNGNGTVEYTEEENHATEQYWP